MKKQVSKTPFWLALVIVLALGGCVPAAQNSGTVAVTAMNIPMPEGAGWNATVVCARGKHQIIRSFAVSGTNLSAELIIPVGTWDITLELTDGDGNVVYHDSAAGVVIYPHRPAVIDFQLKPAHGTVKVIVDLAGHPYADYIMRARVYFSEQVKELTRNSTADALEDEFQIAPGSYDFTVDLYTSSFHSHNRIDPGVWTTIDVEPMSEQTIIWRPLLETMTITAHICLIPDAPQCLNGQYDDGRTELLWEPSPAADLEGYHVYWQPSPFQPYSLIATVDRYTTSYTHDLSTQEELPLQAYYTVAPFSAVLEGYRSPPILVPFL